MLLLRQEMNITQAEFERLLPAAVDHAPVRTGAGEYAGSTAGGRWRIRLGPARERTIGSMRLPLRVVEIHVEGMSEAEADAFRRRFDLYFQKGGG
jgi:hypothetical protein